MNSLFAETLRKLRIEKGISQEQLGKKLFVNHSTVARWESGSRLPDSSMILRIADAFGIDVNTLFRLAAQSEDSPNVIMVDVSKIILSDGLSVLEEVMPNATITGFIWPPEAIEYAKKNRVMLAVLDIELGTASGFDLCRTLIEINPQTNIVFLTAYPDYSLEAWHTEAVGFIVKPITKTAMIETLGRLRYPFTIGGTDK